MVLYHHAGHPTRPRPSPGRHILACWQHRTGRRRQCLPPPSRGRGGLLLLLLLRRRRRRRPRRRRRHLGGGPAGDLPRRNKSRASPSATTASPVINHEGCINDEDLTNDEVDLSSRASPSATTASPGHMSMMRRTLSIMRTLSMMRTLLMTRWTCQ